MIALLGYGGWRLMSSGIAVPQLVGLSQAQAAKKLSAAGLYVGKSGKQDSDQPAGTVLAQDPAAGVRTQSGATVDIVLARPRFQTQAYVPGLSGASQAEVAAAATAAGLRSATFLAFSERADEGAVVEQFPKQGAPVYRDSPVGVVISRGPATGADIVRVPDLAHMTPAQAIARLRRADLVPQRLRMGSSQPSGTLLGQLPRAGSPAQRGDLAGIFVSSGPRVVPRPGVTTKLPALTGLDPNEVLLKTQPVGLQPVFFPMYGRPDMLVDVTYPTAGTELGFASPVLIGLGLPAPEGATAVVPDVMGKSATDARIAAEAAGLVPLAFQLASTKPPGEVVGQVPPAGAGTVPGAKIGFAVSASPAVTLR